MFMKNNAIFNSLRLLQCESSPFRTLSKCKFSQKVEIEYTNEEKEKILNVVNQSDEDLLTQYALTKRRLKNVSKWKTNNGLIKTLSDIELIEGFTPATATKFFDSILDDGTNVKEEKSKTKIKGQILHPPLTDTLKQKSKTVLALYTTVNSVCWSLIDKEQYTLTDWKYYSTEYKEGKRILITDILSTAWQICQHLPQADIYVMKSEATSLRAAGSDPNNPKVLAINLQKAQMVSMIVAILNARSHQNSLSSDNEDNENVFTQKVFFLRSSLPFRLFGTLIGSERVSSDQTIEALLPTYSQKSANNSHVYIPDNVISDYRAQNDLQKDMLGRCLFLALTFMDVCVYNNPTGLDK